MSKKTIKRDPPRERNQFAVATRMRRSGAHGPTVKARRRKEKMDLKVRVRDQEAFVA